MHSQSEALPLLRRLLVRFRLFFLLLLLVRLQRPGLRALLLLRLTLRFRRRRSALGLRALARRRSLRPLSRLIPVGLWPVIRLGGWRPVGLRPVIRLGRWRTIRLRPIVRLGRGWAIGLSSVRFRPSIRRGPVGASGIILRMRGRGIGRWLSCGTIGGRVIRRPCPLGRYDGAVVKRSWLRSSSDWWCAMVG